MKLAFIVGASVLLLSAAIIPAHAFTYDSRTNQNSDGSSKFQDPDSKLGNGQSPRFSMKFSGGSSAANSTGYDSRFVPSGNGAFSAYGSSTALGTALGDRHW
jgi:hypothetical protein